MIVKSEIILVKEESQDTRKGGWASQVVLEFVFGWYANEDIESFKVDELWWLIKVDRWLPLRVSGNFSNKTKVFSNYLASEFERTLIRVAIKANSKRVTS